jgi:hypothetical protein
MNQQQTYALTGSSMLRMLAVCAAIWTGVGEGAAQGIFSAPHLTAEPGSIITVPVQVNGFPTVGAITLFLNYDPASLTFLSAQAMALTGMEVNSFVTAGVGTVAMGWSTASGAALPNGTLVQYQFQYTGGSSALAFDVANCEVAALQGGDIVVLDVAYEDGSVEPSVITGSAPGAIPEELRVFMAEGCLMLYNPTDTPVHLHVLDATGRTVSIHVATARGMSRWVLEVSRPIYRLYHEGQVRTGKPHLMVTQ